MTFFNITLLNKFVVAFSLFPVNLKIFIKHNLFLDLKATFYELNKHKVRNGIRRKAEQLFIQK